MSDIVASGMCWVPETRWAEEVVEEIAGFPFMSHDDLVDSTVMALMRFRQGALYVCLAMSRKNSSTSSGVAADIIKDQHHGD